MKITISGKQVETGSALRQHVEQRLDSVLGKYLDRAVAAHVTVSKSRHQFRADCSAHLSTGLTAQSHAEDSDIYTAFDGALERLEKQLRRYKRRLRNHHRRRAEPVPADNGQSYVLAPQDDEESPDGDDSQPLIVAETTTLIRSLTVGEAVMQMEIAHAPVLVFRNEANGGINVVYQREDGNIGWIDPTSQRSDA